MKLPRYSLRAMLITVAIIAAIVGFVSRQVRIVAQRKAFAEKHSCVRSDMVAVFDAQQMPAPWLLRLLGAESMIAVNVYNDADIVKAKQLFPEAYIVDGRKSGEQFPTNWALVVEDTN